MLQVKALFQCLSELLILSTLGNGVCDHCGVVQGWHRDWSAAARCSFIPEGPSHAVSLSPHRSAAGMRLLLLRGEKGKYSMDI